MGGKKTGPWEGRGDGDRVTLASTCERRDGEARSPGRGGKRMEGGGRRREASSAPGPLPRPQRKTEEGFALSMRPVKKNLTTWEHSILLRNVFKSIAFKITPSYLF